MPNQPSVTLKSLCDLYGRQDTSTPSKSLRKMGIKLELDYEYFGGPKRLWVHAEDVPRVTAYLTRGRHKAD
jgi:hypothetical protein